MTRFSDVPVGGRFRKLDREYLWVEDLYQQSRGLAVDAEGRRYAFADWDVIEPCTPASSLNCTPSGECRTTRPC